MTLGRKNKERDMRTVRGQMMSIPPQHYATGALAAGGTALTINSIPNWARQAGAWAVIGAGGTAAIVRKVAASAITGNQITWSGTAEYAHAAGDPVLFLDMPVFDVSMFGATGSGTETTALQRAITAMQAGYELRITQNYTTGNLQINGQEDFCINGVGRGKLTLTGTGTGTDDYIGIEILGSNESITIRDLEIVGDANTSNWHAGVWVQTSAEVVNLVVENCTIINTQLGIATNAAAGSTARACRIVNNYILNIVGEDSGEGYGIQCGSGSQTTAAETVVQGNYLKGCQRHSIYMSGGGGGVIANNVIVDHRTGASAPASQRPAIVVSRSTDVEVIGNIIDTPNHGAISVTPAATGGQAVRNVRVEGNVIFNPAGSFAAIIVGSVDPTNDEATSGITIANNSVYSSGSNTQHLMIYTGLHVLITGNQFHMLLVTSAAAPLQLRGLGDSGGSATYTDDVNIIGNHFYVTADTGGSAATGIAFYNDFATSTISALIANNAYSVPSYPTQWLATQTNTNVAIFMDDLRNFDRTKLGTGTFAWDSSIPAWFTPSVLRVAGVYGVQFTTNAGGTGFPGATFGDGSANLDVHLFRGGTNLLRTTSNLMGDVLRVAVRTSAPTSPTAGMIAYADGSSWDPGSGAGFYGYEGSAWVKL